MFKYNTPDDAADDSMSDAGPHHTQDAATAIGPDVLARAAEVIKCLGHPLRLRLLEALEGGERAVWELQEYSGATQAAVSQHLGSLRARGIVDSRREGTHVFYRITEPKVMSILNCIRRYDLPDGADPS